jgi:hypothetical protein
MQKSNAWRSKKYLHAANGESCIRCGTDDGTIVSAHYTGIRQHTYGKGRGIKCDDLATADLCQACHTYFDQPAQRKSIETSEEFLHCIVMTIIRRVKAGVLK